MIQEQINAEKLVADHLRADAAVAALVGRRVLAYPPDSIAEPWVRVRQIDAPEHPQGGGDHLVGYLIQLDCYAGATGGQPEASAVCRAVRRSLKEIEGTHDEGISTGARISGGGSRIDDTDIEPARERYIMTAQVWCHP